MSKTRSIITLGSFDGVHRGHQAIFKKIVARARARQAVPTALVFGVPPRYVGKHMERWLLTTLDEKKARLKALGIRRLQVLVFDKKTAGTSPEDFFLKTILGRHGAVEMVVGPRLTFGKNRAGRLPLLRRLGRAHDVKIHVISGVGRGPHVSSSRIRAVLQKGDVEAASEALGYPYEVSGRVVSGDHRGRKLGFPTANIEPDAGKLLPPGVFWVYVEPLKRYGLCNIGTRPTFATAAPRVTMEVYVFGKVRSLYRRRLTVRFLRRLRGEKKFASAAALVRQIQSDVTRAKALSADRQAGQPGRDSL